VVFTVAESPLKAGLLWAGTDDGLVQITQDDGKTWSNVTPKDLPEWSMVSLLDASPHDAASAFIAVDRHKFDDFKPYIYKTHDSGKSWTKISTGIPDGSYVHAVREDPKRKGLLYAGTETGVFVSFDDGAHWQSLKLNMPTTPIADLVVHGNDLAVATHGRSFWVLDDLSPLRQMSQEIAASDVRLFPPSPAVRFHVGRARRGPNEAENPPAGAILYYYVKADQKDPITLDIVDAQKKVIRHYASREKKKDGPPDEGADEGEAEDSPDHPGTKAGMHRFVWDLRYNMPELVPTAIFDMGKPGAPLALPGTYEARLTVGGKTYAAPIDVQADPRATASRADLEQQFALWLKTRDLLGEVHGAVLDMRAVHGQLTALKKRFQGSADEKQKALATQIDGVVKKMDPIEAELIEVKAKSSQDMCNYPTKLQNKIAWLMSSIGGGDSAPTGQEEEFYAEKRRESDAQINAWKKLLSEDIVALNQQIRGAEVPIIQVPLPRGDK
jgi:hypothetical protein